MKKKIFNIFKKYKIIIITASIVFLIGTCSLIFLMFLNGRSLVKEINNKEYAFQYDNTWNLKEKKEDTIVLKHNSNSKIAIKISKLVDEYKYSTIDELIDELIYNIEEQNNGYNLISKEKDKITKYLFDGYKLLYENDDEQVMMFIYKKSDKLVSIQYEAPNDYFDILLNSVHNIIYSLDIKDETFDFKNKLNIQTNDIDYSISEEVDKTFRENKTYEIANNNYYVEYSIPSNFTLNEFDSRSGRFSLTLESGNININVDILNTNIYEYLDKNETINVYNNYSNYHKNNTSDYSNFKETLTELDSNYDSYIYKNSFYNNNAVKYDSTSNSQENKRQDENAELIYALNNNHILIIKLRSEGIPITEKLINMIEVNTSKNYASYIKIEKDNNYLVGYLQRFTDYNSNKIDFITLKIPDKYNEIDKNSNMYLGRYYGLNYNEDMKIYDYDVHYELSTLSGESIIETINSIYINSTYGQSQEMVYSGYLTSNGKQFKVYDGGYTDVSGIMFSNTNRKKYYVNKKVLLYEMSDKGNLYIEINGNGKEITNEVLNELTNFTIEQKEY